MVFDERFDAKPRLDGPDERPWWGGYELRFKLLSKERYQALKGNLIKMQIDAIPIGPDQMRTFSVDFSKHEYTEGKQQCEFDDYAIYVYTPAMLAIEKLRAICQQMDAYPLKGGRRPRARDFYDIHAVLSKEGLDLSSTTNVEVIQHIFAAKEVPLSLLGSIREQREFHRPDWKTVEDAVSGPIEPFDYYFDFVLSEVDRLHALWKE